MPRISPQLTLVLDSERVLTSPYAPSNLPAYFTSNTNLLQQIHTRATPPSFPKALASLPSSPTKSLSNFLSRSPKRRTRDVESSRAFDSPSTGTASQSSDATSRTTNSDRKST